MMKSGKLFVTPPCAVKNTIIILGFLLTGLLGVTILFYALIWAYQFNVLKNLLSGSSTAFFW